MSTHIFKNFFR